MHDGRVGSAILDWYSASLMEKVKKTMTIMGPPGYGPIVPLDIQRHAGLGLRHDNRYHWCAAVNAAYLGAAEMPRAALDYPVAFLRDAPTGEFIPVAVLGMRQKQNLFVDAQGQWQAHRYIPAFFRRYPFCLADIPSADGQQARHMICVQEDQLTPSVRPLFDARGNPTPAWEPILKLLEAVEGARQQTRVFTRRLEALQLLAPFDALAQPAAGAQWRLQGLFRVDERKLQDIPGKDLRTLMKKGELRCLYAHLLSMENFARLMDLSPPGQTR